MSQPKRPYNQPEGESGSDDRHRPAAEPDWKQEAPNLPRASLRPARLLTSAALRKVKASDILSDVQEKQKTGGDTLSPSHMDPVQGSHRLTPKQLLKKSVRPQAAAAARTETASATPSLSQPPADWVEPSAQPENIQAPAFSHAVSDQRSDLDQWRQLDVFVRRVLRTTGRVLKPVAVMAWEHRGLAARLFANRKLVGSVAVLALVAFLWDSPLINSSFAAVGRTVDPYVENVKARAAFQIIDDFDSGVGEGWDDSGLVPAQPGTVRIAGLALNTKTMDLASYRMDFDAKIESRSVGWLVRAADRETYYAFKLIESGRGNSKKYRLLRYPMVDGKPDETRQAEIEIPAGLVEEDFNRISVRTRDNQIATFVNGRGIDFWTDSSLPKGGVGFWVEKGSSGIVRQFALSGNEDFWGLTLYAAMETAAAVGDFVTDLMANPSQVGSRLQKGLSEIGPSGITN